MVSGGRPVNCSPQSAGTLWEEEGSAVGENWVQSHLMQSVEGMGSDQKFRVSEWRALRTADRSKTLLVFLFQISKVMRCPTCSENPTKCPNDSGESEGNVVSCCL